MKSWLLLLTMAGAMGAQTLVGLPDLKVELAGTTETPILINHLDKNIIAYVLRSESSAGIAALRMFDISDLARNPKAGITPGDKHVYEPDLGPMQKGHTAPTKVSVDAVLTSEGQFLGPNTLELSFETLAVYVNSVRDFAIQALEAPGLVPATLQAFNSLRAADLARGTWKDQVELVSRGETAEQIELIRSESGPGAAQDALTRLSHLPKL